MNLIQRNPNYLNSLSSMKTIKIMTITLMMCSVFTSCSDKEELKNEVIKTVPVAFGGMLSSRGKVTINGNQVLLNTIYQAKKGDVLKFTDPGDDWTYPPIYISDPFQFIPGYTEEGVTYGEIIVETGSVANSYGQVDVNLTYTVK